MVETVKLQGRFWYAVPMSEDEYRALEWIGDRYTCAGILRDRSCYRANVLLVPEGTAHEYLTELEQENGGGMIVPPCAGGRLADNLADLYSAVV